MDRPDGRERTRSTDERPGARTRVRASTEDSRSQFPRDCVIFKWNDETGCKTSDLVIFFIKILFEKCYMPVT